MALMVALVILDPSKGFLAASSPLLHLTLKGVDGISNPTLASLNLTTTIDGVIFDVRGKKDRRHTSSSFCHHFHDHYHHSRRGVIVSVAEEGRLAVSFAEEDEKDRSIGRWRRRHHWYRGKK
ncbi:hypothetical protein L1049_011749 [Liquidambar formosana]|uniref:Uncharacterized protein n=1 Tax=Liquidambar formosana TaxID=63359 RepID=A0AAP0RRV8_LIQFO